MLGKWNFGKQTESTLIVNEQWFHVFAEGALHSLLRCCRGLNLAPSSPPPLTSLSLLSFPNPPLFFTLSLPLSRSNFELGKPHRLNPWRLPFPTPLPSIPLTLSPPMTTSQQTDPVNLAPTPECPPLNAPTANSPREFGPTEL